MTNFHPLQVVGLSSEIQLQVGENLKRIWVNDLHRPKTYSH